MREFRFTEKTERAAQLLAAEWSIAKAARAAGVDEKTVDRWKLRKDFVERIDHYRRAMRERITKQGAAVKENRIGAMRKRIKQLMHAIRIRAGEPARGGAGWDESGFFVRRERTLHVGFNEYEKVEEFELDTAVMAELRALEEAIAIEMGERKQKVEHSGEIKTPAAPHVVVLAKVLPPEILAQVIAQAEAETPSEDQP